MWGRKGKKAVIKLRARCQRTASEGAWVSQSLVSKGMPAGAGTVFNSVLVCSGEAMAVSDQCRGSLLKRSNSFQTQEDSGVLSCSCGKMSQTNATEHPVIMARLII